MVPETQNNRRSSNSGDCARQYALRLLGSARKIGNRRAPPISCGFARRMRDVIESIGIQAIALMVACGVCFSCTPPMKETSAPVIVEGSPPFGPIAVAREGSYSFSVYATDSDGDQLWARLVAETERGVGLVASDVRMQVRPAYPGPRNTYMAQFAPVYVCSIAGDPGSSLSVYVADVVFESNTRQCESVPSRCARQRWTINCQ